MDTREMANNDRAQINNGFQQLNQSTLHSIRQLDLKLEEINVETNRVINQITNALSSQFKQQSDHLATIIKPSASRDFNIDASLEKFKDFGLQEPLTGRRILVEKQPLKGCSTGTYFEFPQVTSSAKDELFVAGDFAQRVLTKLEACTGVGIYSIRLGYSDGTRSPLFGNKEPNQCMQLAEQDSEPAHVATIKMQAWDGNYV